eukprot:TRINITY_DN37970_c0_g1_i1.p1 TRINITY_DN37970_c0_g1~~TRINITY_DN37970_c0_g1_i1.p1  ORF type:complete len:542 (-),score=92.45 TRINITY_DN37970_c0_g1_i1:339-1964(-)
MSLAMTSPGAVHAPWFPMGQHVPAQATAIPPSFGFTNSPFSPMMHFHPQSARGRPAMGRTMSPPASVSRSPSPSALAPNMSPRIAVPTGSYMAHSGMSLGQHASIGSSVISDAGNSDSNVASRQCSKVLLNKNAVVNGLVSPPIGSPQTSTRSPLVHPVRFFSQASASTAVPESPESSRRVTMVPDTFAAALQHGSYTLQQYQNRTDSPVVVSTLENQHEQILSAKMVDGGMDVSSKMQGVVGDASEVLSTVKTDHGSKFPQDVKRSPSKLSGSTLSRSVSVPCVNALARRGERAIPASARGQAMALESAALAEEKRRLLQAQEWTEQWVKKSVLAQLKYVENMERRTQTQQKEEERSLAVLQEQRQKSARAVAAKAKANSKQRKSCFERHEEQLSARLRCLERKLVVKDSSFEERSAEMRAEKLAVIAELSEVQNAKGKAVRAEGRRVQKARVDAAADAAAVEDERMAELEAQLAAIRAERRYIQEHASAVMEEVREEVIRQRRWGDWDSSIIANKMTALTAEPAPEQSSRRRKSSPRVR